MYVIDSDALITAFRHDFPPDKDPSTFWDWLSQMNKERKIVVPEKVFEEIEDGTDDLHSFLANDKNIKKEPTSKAMPYLPRVIKSYGELAETDLEELEKKADPYLIAHALDLSASVITNETTKPDAAPHNKKIPDICLLNGIKCIRYPRFLWDIRGGKKK